MAGQLWQRWQPNVPPVSSDPSMTLLLAHTLCQQRSVLWMGELRLILAEDISESCLEFFHHSFYCETALHSLLTRTSKSGA